jgi:hypothetical protein
MVSQNSTLIQTVGQLASLEKLYLLVPWNLPILYQLHEGDKNKFQLALKQILRASEQTSHLEALATISQALVTFSMTDLSPAQLSSTNTYLKSWEVEDYDNYFGVTHVNTSEPAACLIKSVLVAYQTFLLLNCQSSQFNPCQIKLQKRGFAGYARLLARVFNLSLEENR